MMKLRSELFLVFASSLVAITISCGDPKTVASAPSGPTTTETAQPATPPAYYAYAVNAVDYTVSQYSINGDGTLKPLSAASVPTGVCPARIALDVKGKHAYVANTCSQNISQYSINSDGSLTAMNPATISAGSADLEAIAVDPLGRCVYATDYFNNAVLQYTITPGGGLAAGIPTVATGQAPASIAVDPSGKYAYVANSGDGTVSQYTLSSNGLLSPMNTQTVVAGDNPDSIKVDPSGKHVYVANDGSAAVPNGGSNSVSQYSINSDGSLTPMSPATVGGTNGPVFIAVHPSGKYVYATDTGNNGAAVWNDVAGYTVGPDGSLTPFPGSTLGTGPSPWSIAFDPTGKYAYVALADSTNIAQYVVNSDGSLSPLNPATAATGTKPEDIVTVQLP